MRKKKFFLCIFALVLGNEEGWFSVPGNEDTVRLYHKIRTTGVKFSDRWWRAGEPSGRDKAFSLKIGADHSNDSQIRQAAKSLTGCIRLANLRKRQLTAMPAAAKKLHKAPARAIQPSRKGLTKPFASGTISVENYLRRSSAIERFNSSKNTRLCLRTSKLSEWVFQFREAYQCIREHI